MYGYQITGLHTRNNLPDDKVDKEEQGAYARFLKIPQRLTYFITSTHQKQSVLSAWQKQLQMLWSQRQAVISHTYMASLQRQVVCVVQAYHKPLQHTLFNKSQVGNITYWALHYLFLSLKPNFVPVHALCSIYVSTYDPPAIYNSGYSSNGSYNKYCLGLTISTVLATKQCATTAMKAASGLCL